MNADSMRQPQPLTTESAGRARRSVKTAASVRPGLLRSMSWSFFGNLFDVSCAWLFMTILVKMGSSEMVGQYGLAMAYLGPVFAFTNMQMRALQATDVRQQTAFGTYMLMRWITLTVAFVAICTILASDGSSPGAIALTLIMFGRLALIAIDDVFTGLLQQHEWIDRMAQVQMATAAALVGSFALGLVLTGSLVASVGISAIALVGALLFVHLPMARALQRTTTIRDGLAVRWNRAEMRDLLTALLPLGIVSFLISMQASVPRFFLDRRADTSELGVFVALTALLTAGIALTASVSQAIMPRLARLRANGDRAGFIRLLLRAEMGAFSLLIAGVIATWAIGPHVVRLIYSEEYAAYTAAQVWLAIACGITLMGWFIGNAITVARQLRVQVANNLISLATMIALCAILVPRYSVTGAVAAIAGAAAVQVLLNLLVCLRFLARWQTPPAQSVPESSTPTSRDALPCAD